MFLNSRLLALSDGVCFIAVEVAAGHYLDISAHTKHRVAWTTPDEPTIWLAVHYGEKN